MTTDPTVPPVPTPSATPSATPPTTPPLASAAVPCATDAQARIAHLFRTARRRGQIHPLQHLIERYRAQQALADRPAPPP